jgi:hypothetical protein
MSGIAEDENLGEPRHNLLLRTNNQPNPHLPGDVADRYADEHWHAHLANI